MFKRYLLAPGRHLFLQRFYWQWQCRSSTTGAPEFLPLFEEARQNLKWLFQTKNDVLILSSSGTGGMEGSVTNFLSPGDKALVINGGKFGERWLKICQAYGITPVEIKVEWGYAVRPEDVEKALRKDPTIKAVLMQASETSTGVAHDTKAIADIVKTC